MKKRKSKGTKRNERLSEISSGREVESDLSGDGDGGRGDGG